MGLPYMTGYCSKCGNNQTFDEIEPKKWKCRFCGFIKMAK